jgi:hypothetical protein
MVSNQGHSSIEQDGALATTRRRSNSSTSEQQICGVPEEDCEQNTGNKSSSEATTSNARCSLTSTSLLMVRKEYSAVDFEEVWPP